MKYILPILLFLSCAKPYLPAPPVRGDIAITIERLEYSCSMDLYLQLVIGGQDAGASQDNRCGIFPIDHYKGMLLWDVPLQDVYFRVAGWKVYQSGRAEWIVTLTGPADIFWRYRYQVDGLVLTVEEWQGNKLYRTYKQEL